MKSPVRQYFERSQFNSTNSQPDLKAEKSSAIGKPPHILNVAFDVGSDSLNWSMELGGRVINGDCCNHSRDIRKTLGRIMNQASEYNCFDIRIICESTGIYHRRLLQIANSLGMRTSLVHGEAVAKYRAIQFADHGKTDRRDPQAALTVAKVGRLIKHRQLDKHYAQLRELHRLVLRCAKPASRSPSANCMPTGVTCLPTCDWTSRSCTARRVVP